MREGLLSCSVAQSSDVAEVMSGKCSLCLDGPLAESICQSCGVYEAVGGLTLKLWESTLALGSDSSVCSRQFNETC